MVNPDENNQTACSQRDSDYSSTTGPGEFHMPTDPSFYLKANF
jgi:hypothetical protein